MEGADKPDVTGFEVIDIQPQVVKALQSAPARRFVSAFGNAGPPVVQKIGVGDSVVVTIWEAAGGGLFSEAGVSGATGSRSITLPPRRSITRARSPFLTAAASRRRD